MGTLVRVGRSLGVDEIYEGRVLEGWVEGTGPGGRKTRSGLLEGKRAGSAEERECGCDVVGAGELLTFRETREGKVRIKR